MTQAQGQAEAPRELTEPTGSEPILRWEPSHATCEENLDEAQRVIEGLRETTAESVGMIDREIEKLDAWKAEHIGPTIEVPYLMFAVTYSDAMCKAKKACPITGFSEDICRLQILREMCSSERGNLCEEDETIRLRKSKFFACLGQLATEWSCDYSRPMDMCRGQYIVKPGE